MDFDPQTWPIAAAMLPFPGVQPDGTSTQDAPAETWAECLQEVCDVGFTEVDPTDSWLRVADLPPSRLAEFQAIVKGLDLTIPAISTARRSVIDRDFGSENLAYSHRVIDVAPALGATIVNIGLLPRLTEKQQAAQWFWTEPSTVDPDDMVVRRMAARRIRELAVHAAEMGVSLSLEMYEDTYLGTADSAVHFLHEIDHSSVGLNPDLGNLLRMQRPVERWRSMLLKVLPYANYWHVKNYFRMEDPARGIVLTTPAPMEFGVMDYRTAISDAIAAGYRSAFCVEHYGGDGLGVSATNARYLRGLLARSVLRKAGQPDRDEKAAVPSQVVASGAGEPLA